MSKSIIIIIAILFYANNSCLCCLADTQESNHAENQTHMDEINTQLERIWSKQLDSVTNRTKEHPAVVIYFIDNKGAVQNPRILNSSKNQNIDNKILETIKQIKVTQSNQHSSEMVLDNCMFSSIFIGKDVHTDSVKLEVHPEWLPAYH